MRSASRPPTTAHSVESAPLARLPNPAAQRQILRQLAIKDRGADIVAGDNGLFHALGHGHHGPRLGQTAQHAQHLLAAP